MSEYLSVAKLRRLIKSLDDDAMVEIMVEQNYAQIQAFNAYNIDAELDSDGDAVWLTLIATIEVKESIL